jgi:hypothetical protein
VRQRGYSLGNIPIRRPLEIEQDWQLVPFPKFLTDGLKHGLAVGRESAKDQNDLGRDGVDDVTDVLIF